MTFTAWRKDLLLNVIPHTCARIHTPPPLSRQSSRTRRSANGGPCTRLATNGALSRMTMHLRNEATSLNQCGMPRYTLPESDISGHAELRTRTPSFLHARLKLQVALEPCKTFTPARVRTLIGAVSISQTLTRSTTCRCLCATSRTELN